MISHVSGQIPEKKRYNATQISEAPVIDGVLNDKSGIKVNGQMILRNLNRITGKNHRSIQNLKYCLTITTFLLQSNRLIQAPTAL